MDSVSSDHYYGAMSDGSKRQRDDESEWGLLSELEGADIPTTAYYANTVNPAPPMPCGGGHVVFPQVPLPNDVPTVEEWSRTVIKLPQVATYIMTYAEFIIKAEVPVWRVHVGELWTECQDPEGKEPYSRSGLCTFPCALNGSGMTQGTFSRVLRD